MIETLLKMSLTGTIVICVVLLLRRCLRCAPKIFSYVLWLIVLFRLLCPVSVALPVSVFHLIPIAQTNVTDQLPEWEHSGNGNVKLTESAGIAGKGLDASKEDVVIEESIKRNSICIKILIAGLFCTGVAILALIYHVITI